MSFDLAAKDTAVKSSGQTKNSVKTASKNGTPVTIKFRNPIIAYAANTPITDDKQSKGLDINSFGSSPTVRERHSKNREILKTQNAAGHLMKKSLTTPNTPTNIQSNSDKSKQKAAKKYASSLPPPISNGENSPLEIYTKGPELLQQSPTHSSHEYKKLSLKENTDLLQSPKIQPNNASKTKPNDRRFSVGLFTDNQLPLSAVYDHNLIGSELGNEFSTLNEFLNLLDPDQQQLDVYNSTSAPGVLKNNPHQFNPMSPNSSWLNGNSNAPSQNINYLKGIKSPQGFRELPNILEPSNVVVNDNNFERIEPFSEQQQPSSERDDQSQSNQKPMFERNKFTKNYTRHNFPTLRNHHTTAANQSSIYSEGSKVVIKPQNRFIKRASYTVSAKENFFLTAAAPSAVLHAKERLTEVIKAKLDAGLLKPYDYSKGYDRIHDFLTESSATMVNKQKIYKVLNDLRPQYVKITSKLKSVELVLVEESFEVMLLSLERVFSTIATPSCCWRRTGEIYRGNQEFATLAGCDIEDLRDGRLTIYELMDEESYCRYFELFGYSSLKSSQKAVLTHCNLKNRDVNCCFSFTIKRDEYNIPVCIIGNFLPSE